MVGLLFCKIPDTRYAWLCRSHSLCLYSTLHSTNAAINNTEIHEYGYVPVKLYFQKNGTHKP